MLTSCLSSYMLDYHYDVMFPLNTNIKSLIYYLILIIDICIYSQYLKSSFINFINFLQRSISKFSTLLNLLVSSPILFRTFVLYVCEYIFEK